MGNENMYPPWKILTFKYLPSQKPTMPSVFKINRLLVTFAALNNEITYGEKVWDGKLSLWKQDFRSLQLNQLSNLFTTPFRGLVAMNIFYEYIFDFFSPLLYFGMHYARLFKNFCFPKFLNPTLIESDQCYDRPQYWQKLN